MENIQMSFLSEEDTIVSEPKDKLDVVKLDFVQGETTTWKNLFTGFNTLKRDSGNTNNGDYITFGINGISGVP